ncbi:hypothetical protein FRC06_009179, partial [Ceratobasidium sp. 370]
MFAPPNERLQNRKEGHLVALLPLTTPTVDSPFSLVSARRSFWKSADVHKFHFTNLDLYLAAPSLSGNTKSTKKEAILKNVNERNAHLQKQLDNIVREGLASVSPHFRALKRLFRTRVANSELTLLNNKLTGVERDLELERRKTRDLMDTARERDKEYQKLKASLSTPYSPLVSRLSPLFRTQKTQYDNLKRKTILTPNTLATAAANEAAHQLNRTSPVDQQQNQRIGNMTDIAGGMDANR